jgi:hypothetical protein
MQALQAGTSCKDESSKREHAENLCKVTTSTASKRHNPKKLKNLETATTSKASTRAHLEGADAEEQQQRHRHQIVKGDAAGGQQLVQLVEDLCFVGGRGTMQLRQQRAKYVVSGRQNTEML